MNLNVVVVVRSLHFVLHRSRGIQDLAHTLEPLFHRIEFLLQNPLRRRLLGEFLLHAA